MYLKTGRVITDNSAFSRCEKNAQKQAPRCPRPQPAAPPRRARLVAGATCFEKSGLNRTYLSAVERSEQNISVDNIARLAAALNIEAGDLLEAGS